MESNGLQIGITLGGLGLFGLAYAALVRHVTIKKMEGQTAYMVVVGVFVTVVGNPLAPETLRYCKTNPPELPNETVFPAATAAVVTAVCAALPMLMVVCTVLVAEIPPVAAL